MHEAIRPRSTEASSAPVDNHGSQQYFPTIFSPGSNDVLIGRGKKCSQHPGNEKLRRLVDSKLHDYSSATTKKDKTNILLSIVSEVRMNSPNGGFIKLDSTVGLWFEVGDHLAREKVSQTFRDALHSCYRSSNEFKKKRKREQNGKEYTCMESSKRSRLGVDLRHNDDLLSDVNAFEFADNLVGTVGVDSLFPPPLPDSCSLTSWFEDESFEPIPISEAPQRDLDLFEPLLLSGDFEKFIGQLNDNNPKVNEAKSQGGSQPTISSPSRNSCAARTA